MSYEYTDHIEMAKKHVKTAEAAALHSKFELVHHELSKARQEITRALIQVDQLRPIEPEAA